jgi:hypothetical protein
MESTSERLMDESQRSEGQHGPAGRRALTDEEWHVLNEAAESALLVSAVNSWEPTPDLKVKAKYVPRIAAAAESLIEAGLIDIYEEHVGPGESVLLFRDEARAAVAAYDRWWGEDEDEEPTSGSDERTPDTFLSLLITDAGWEMLRSGPPEAFARSRYRP